ncbi:MAG TPA: hypothetical protein DD827_08505, partial [Gammaproteobacteria bacterium]|nr:hypothetical protein [Gammaproteobacteria bacterium]
RIEDAIAQVTGLIFLGKEKEALQAQQEISHQPWWDESTQVASYALLKHFAAVCHARTGDIAQAKSLWNEALEQHPDLEVAEQNLQDIRMPASERNGVWPLSLYELIPSRWLDKIRQGQSERATIDITKPLSNSYIERICQLGDKTTITLGETLLLKRFEGGDLETKPILIALLEGRQGNYKERFSFSSQLLEAGVIDRQDPINLWDGEQPQKIQVKGNLINNKPKPTTLTLKQQSKMAEALDAFRNGDIPCAKRILKKLCDETNDASAWGNFAATYEKTGDHKKAEMLMKRAVKVDPDYLMGRCNLAMFYIRRGDTDKAKELLEGLLDTEQLHIQEAITLYGAYAVLSAREGDLDRANTLLDSVQEMAEDYDETDRLQMYRNMVDVPLLDKFTGLFSRLAKGAEND